MRLIDAEKLSEHKFPLTPLRYHVGWNDAIDTIVENAPTIEAEPVVQWISIDKALPDKGVDVLMYFDTGNMAVGFMTDQDEYLTFWSTYTDDGWYTDCDCSPVYWRLLPKPPKED